jgi:hypothetical protein
LGCLFDPKLVAVIGILFHKLKCLQLFQQLLLDYMSLPATNPNRDSEKTNNFVNKTNFKSGSNVSQRSELPLLSSSFFDLQSSIC